METLRMPAHGINATQGHQLSVRSFIGYAGLSAQYRYNLSELRQLLQRAVTYCKDDRPYPIAVMYRNKPRSYFDDIFFNRKGIMEVYHKDHSGDPACPLNGRMKGLFFNTLANPYTGALPLGSPFGDVRLIISIGRMVTPAHKLYFADFYCSHTKHLVTLVVARRGTSADQWCTRKLIELPIHQNPFLFRDAAGNFHCSRRNTVEVLFTDDINLLEELKHKFTVLREVRAVGRRRSIPNSQPKNSACTICNIFPVHVYRNEQ